MASAVQKATASAESGTVQIAQLPGTGGAPATAAELIRKADCYLFYHDLAGGEACLEQAVAAEEGTPDAARARALLASALAESDPARSAALFSEVAQQYSDPELLAFASLVQSEGTAARAQDWQQVEAVLSAAAATWRGTATGAWAALKLADYYRTYPEDWARAEAVYRQAISDYAGAPTAEEAALGLAQTLEWSEGKDFEQIFSLYNSLVTDAQSPYVRLEAMVGISATFNQLRDWEASAKVASLVIGSAPNHPAAGFASILRAYASDIIGNLADAVTDVQTYLESPNQQASWRAYGHDVLARYAYQQGRLDEAEREFTTLLDLASVHAGRGFRGKARVGLAACAKARGDLRGALQLYLQAADAELFPCDKATDLYLAADLAQELSDSATRGQIVARMAAELPGSHLTTKLVGHELLPPPEI
jgi:hypothetical protein